MRFAVKASTGLTVHTLRIFSTREEAECHPVKMSLWTEVWIEEVAPLPPREPLGRLPWSIEEPAGNRFTYLRDADGRRMASLFGTFEDRQATIRLLRERGLIEPESTSPPPLGRLPWSIEETAGNSFAYLRDADGHRMASLFGTFEDRQAMIRLLRERGLIEPESTSGG